VPVKTVLAEIVASGESTAQGPGLRVPGPALEAANPAPTTRNPEPAEVRRTAIAGRIVASPRARMRAHELGVPLGGITGSGPGGRIMEDDVLKASKEVGTLTLPSSPTAGEGDIAPLARIRRITAERMSASARSVARVTLFLDVDFSEAVRFRAQLAPEFARLGVTKLPWDAIIGKAAALALGEHPAVNAQWVEGQGVRHPQGINVGIAVALDPEGLIVPVLRDAYRRSLRDLAGDLLSLTERAHAGRLSPEEMNAGTFTITNLGGHGIDGFTPIINPPETAILGVGRIAEKPAVVDHQLQVREMCTLSLSFDHRVVDGAPAAACLSRLGQLLERPYALLEI
jgi:pyruvate dehydrogenase E2 component (dihydrolipoyllysine-residue acetyltransferase)